MASKRVGSIIAARADSARMEIANQDFRSCAIAIAIPVHAAWQP
jgi:hypothetical protein